MCIILIVVVLASLAGGVEVRNLNSSHLSGLLLTYFGADRASSLSCVIVNRSRASSHVLAGAHIWKTFIVALRVVAGVLLRHGVTESVRCVSIHILELFDVGIGTLHHS